MPQINRIRVNNVKYNFGTQVYDDFVMRFSCKNTIYDLANGGGKSVLMLLLLQNLIPNCTLDEKQPVEKLFRTGSGSNTIHSLIEWKLDKEDIKNNYKYMLTGFCARKAKDDEQNQLTENGEGVRENAAIEYFNYCIFYRDFNDNDLKNLPLQNGSEKITYTGLKNYLRELEKKDFSLEIKIFDRKGEYQRFIAGYGLFESQWEIIRGINKTEGHVRTYFETNYKTTRKVVEDLLIEEIIEKSFNNRVGKDEKTGDNSGDGMAKTLLDIKDKLIELSNRREDIACFDRQIEAIESFGGRVFGIRQLYFGKEELEEQIIKSYNTLNKIIEKRDRAKKEYEEGILELKQEKIMLEKSISTLHVMKDEAKIKEIDSILSEISEKLTSLKQEYARKKNTLLVMESENDYMDYLYYKSERDSVREAIDRITADDVNEQETRNRLSALALEKKNRNNKKIAEILGSIDKEKESLELEEKSAAELEAQENEYIQTVSVAEYMLKDWEKKTEEINSRIYSLKEELGMVLVGDMNNPLKQCLEELEKAKADLREQDEMRIKSAVEEKELEYAYRDAVAMSENLEKTVESCVESLARMAQADEHIGKLKELYSENNIEELEARIQARYDETACELADMQKSMEITEAYCENLKKGCLVGATPELNTVLEYIRKYHGDVARTGSSYIAGLPIEDREDILYKVPFLSYGIVITENFSRISQDTGLKNLLIGDYAIPLFKEEALKMGKYILEDSAVTFVTRDINLLTDKEALDKEILRQGENLKDLEDRCRSLGNSVIVLKEDLESVSEYRNIYIAKKAEDENTLTLAKDELKKIRMSLEDISEKKIENAGLKEEIIEKTELLQNNIAYLDKKSGKISLVLDLSKEESELSANISKIKAKKETLRKEHGDIVARLRAMKSNMEYKRSRIKALNQSVEEINKAFGELYATYYREDAPDMGYDFKSESDEELDSLAKTLNQIVNSTARDIKDKQKLVENYDIAMEKSLEAIDYKGVSVDEIKKSYEEGKLRSHSRDELKSFRALTDVVENTIKEMENRLSKERTGRDHLEGSVTLRRATIEEKYGPYEEENITDISLEEAINEKTVHLKDVDISLSDMAAKKADLDETDKDFIIYKRDLDKIMEGADIVIPNKELIWDENVDIAEKLKTVSGRYDKYRKDIASRKDEFEHEKITLSDTLKAMSAFRLADEIRNNVEMPRNLVETEELKENLDEINRCIALEKQQIEKSISDLERIKDNFENQCIQSCINIKTELERLPKLSRINMDGETISIIDLSVPYIAEDNYKAHMSEYIDNIVSMADSLRSEEERIKYIKSQLSWKKLFSVIVKDMNAIKLTLYKRERIKEQSRYLRYEEAVGSTGQSQGIYIQFLIAIINYITSINSGNMNSKDYGKTIFIDNPFGAAKDVYIWEPIFKMLKTNNVQLIVPCRGATPAITGRFDVNYVLGQKMIDGKQQTVVVEYYSNVESEALEYTKLSYEQNTLNFE